MRTTIYHDVLECAASWPGMLLSELHDSGEVTCAITYLRTVVAELRSEGLLLRASPSLLRVVDDWQAIVQNMAKRDQVAAAAIAAGADSYDALCGALGKTKATVYSSGHRLVNAGAVLHPHGLYLSPGGERLLKDRQRRRERQRQYRSR